MSSKMLSRFDREYQGNCKSISWFRGEKKINNLQALIDILIDFAVKKMGTRNWMMSE